MRILDDAAHWRDPMVMMWFVNDVQITRCVSVFVFEIRMHALLVFSQRDSHSPSIVRRLSEESEHISHKSRSLESLFTTSVQGATCEDWSGLLFCKDYAQYPILMISRTITRTTSCG